jgi:hypothetical protein
LGRVRVTIVAVEKALGIKYSEYVSAHAPYCIVVCGLSGFTTFFFTLSDIRHDFEKNKVVEDKMCVFSLQLLSETFIILRRIQQVIMINVRRYSCEVPAILVRF